MLDQAPTNLTVRMIASLEEANTRSYQELKSTVQQQKSADQKSSRSEQDLDHPSPDQQPARKRRLPHILLWFFALVGLILPASVYVNAFVWNSAATLTFSRWVNASTLLQSTLQDRSTPEPVIAPEVERRLQRMAAELDEARRGIEQLKQGQEEMNQNNALLARQFEAGQEQTARDNSEVVDQFNSRLAKRDAAIAAQMKATQDQLSEAISYRPVNPTRKAVRPRRASSPGAYR
jgi:hypothetical protein